MFFKEWFNSSIMDKKKSAREIASEITEKFRDPEHLGKHTPETLQQELFSLKNTKPAFRDGKWTVKLGKLNEEISKIKDQRKQDSLTSNVEAMLSGEQ